MKRIYGNCAGLKPNQTRRLENLYRRRMPPELLVTPELGRDLCLLSHEIRRQIGVLIDRSGRIVFVVVGDPRRIVIPATAAMGGRRLGWARVAAIGPHVRTLEVGDRVLFDPEDKAEVEVNAETYILMRERDVHAVAADRLGDSQTGLYL